MATRNSSTYGFARTSKLISSQVRKTSEGRGFAQHRLLTQWTEIAGAHVAQVSRPVEVSYARGGFGATLTLLTTGAQAPMLEMQKEALRTKVNAVYGYNAIARIRITQTAPTGFAEGQVDFDHAPARQAEPKPDPETRSRAAQTVAPVEDEGLRTALEQLGTNIMSRKQKDDLTV